MNELAHAYGYSFGCESLMADRTGLGSTTLPRQTETTVYLVWTTDRSGLAWPEGFGVQTNPGVVSRSLAMQD